MHGKIGAVDYADQKSVGQQGLLEKFRVQLPVILGLTILIQLVVGGFTHGIGSLPEQSQNAVFLSLAANLLGLLSYRRLRLYPGARRLAYVIPSFALSWAVVGLFLLATRIPYSVIQLTVGLVSGLGLAVLLNTWSRSADLRPLSLIPSLRVDQLLRDLPHLNYQFCRSPIDIEQTKSALVADLHAELPREWEQALARAALRGTPIYHVKQISESLTGKVQIEHLSENAFGTLGPNPAYAAAKSIVERFLAVIALVLLSPILLVAAVAIRLESPGPAIFRQKRVGYRGEHFTIFKLRTMATPTSPSSGLQADITIENDPRITRLGRWLRDLRIDEIPQLVNVALGDMSIVGPRPETVKLSQWYEETLDFYPYRHIVLPGITGWAQVRQGHVASTDDVFHKLQYDFYYIKNYSLWLDLVIALRTVGVMLRKLGAR